MVSWAPGSGSRDAELSGRRVIWSGSLFRGLRQHHAEVCLATVHVVSCCVDSGPAGIRDLGDYFGAKKRQSVELPRSDPTGPMTALDRRQHREKLVRVLDALSDDHRQVLLLRFFEGLTAEQTGERMSRSAGAVRKLAARALAELGKTL